MRRYSRFQKTGSLLLMASMAAQIAIPTQALALTSGPTQPEAQGFEPVGTTDMVDPFTGDFVYNIPLLDVEGYPVNISYHGGVGMEQEASWVGLGWSLTPGVINKAIRGIPDDFNGDSIEKELYIKPDINKRIGLNAVGELAGLGQPVLRAEASVGATLNISNYRGMSLDFSTSLGLGAAVNTPVGMVGAGMNVGASIGSQSGAAFDYSANVGVGITNVANSGLSGGFNLNTSGVYSPRNGMRREWGYGMNLSYDKSGSYTTSQGKERFVQGKMGVSTGVTVPIGLQNYSAVVSNAASTNSFMGRIKVGAEFYGGYASGSVFGYMSKTRFEENGSRPSYGYFNLEDGGDNALLDFSREKDGNYNPTMQLLPQTALTYDVYSLSGQGTGGSFRPFRNDIGSVYDPTTETSTDESSLELEAGIGMAAEGGADGSRITTDIKSGPWKFYQRQYGPDDEGLYEKVVFKEAGELTSVNEAFLQSINGSATLTPNELLALPKLKSGATQQRVARSNYIYTLTSTFADRHSLLSGYDLQSYDDTNGFAAFPTVAKTAIPRSTYGSNLRRREHHVTEIVQVQKDGRRYVYGLPVVNNVQREVVFAILPSNTANRKTGLVSYNKGVDDHRANGNGRDHFYSSTVTPTYVTSHLLTGVLSADYSDLTGNGISDDDPGSYTKFNYSRKSADYRWRAPIEQDSAQWISGYLSDRYDDKACYTIGSREQWYLHSIETKNFVAEFYTSRRHDAQGITDKILQGLVYTDNGYTQPLSQPAYSYKLDSIVVFNKHDRFINGSAATPVKSVHFRYDYSLCKLLPNSAMRWVNAGQSGKLTLKEIQVRFGTSNYNMTAPYRFAYNGVNPTYASANKDRWGGYRPTGEGLTNFEFPFVKQDEQNDIYAGAWSLTDIQLPTGGKIKVGYEADDYAFVQDKEAMEMFLVKGAGVSEQFIPSPALYFSSSMPALYLYFDRRQSSENPGLSAKDNYLRGTSMLYYNIPVALRAGQFENVKGYATAKRVGYCSDGIHGYIELESRDLKGTDANANPIVFTALNLGRYNLPHILYPGSDPESSDLDNIVRGLFNSLGELISGLENPLQHLMDQNCARTMQLSRGFVRLTSPGLRKEGGGQRVKRIEFFDSWASMTGGADSTAIYGREYNYTDSLPGRGRISSGVASYEPLIGGDELPQRQPAGYQVQQSNNFPPNDPVDVFQETPIGESFFPGPVVGYSRITVRSIHQGTARSAQFEDVHTFYTAKNFPIRTDFTPVDQYRDKDVDLWRIDIEQRARQGFSITLNDMHGKPQAVEHYVLLPATAKREPVSYTQYTYRTSGGQLDNRVNVYEHRGDKGKMYSVARTLGVETDVALDARERVERTETIQGTVSANFFPIPIPPFVGVLGMAYGWDRVSKMRFSMATATKITQQYGIPDRVIQYKEGAITEQVNEVWNDQTGSPVVTSVNNEFKDREYTVTHPAYWGYKEMAPAYRTQHMSGTWPNVVIDSLGPYASRLINWPGTQAYPLPSHFPVARVAIDEGLPLYNLGDEILVYLMGPSANPTRLWMMGYTSDQSHCYLVLAPREPYLFNYPWIRGSTLSNVPFKVARSGQRNRLSETIQSVVSAKREDVLPVLTNNYASIVSLQAQTMNHKLTRVPARHETNDSLNPFITAKIGMPRPEKTVVNIKDRLYNTGSARHAGLFPSEAYWKTVKDTIPVYCADTSKFNCKGPMIKWVTFNRIPNTNHIRVDYEMFPSSPGQKEWTWDHPGSTNNPWNTLPGIQGTVIISNVPSAFFTAGPNLNNRITFAYQNNAFIGNTSQYCRSIVYLEYEQNKIRVYMHQNGPSYVTSNPPYTYTTYQFSGTIPPGALSGGHYVTQKIQLATVSHNPATTLENWVSLQRAVLYDASGNELENEEPGIGSNAAVYAYHHSLPATVAKNATYGSVLFEGFEDYSLLNALPSQNADYLKLHYSPFVAIWTGTLAVSSAYNRYNTTAPSYQLVKGGGHTGTYGLRLNNALSIPILKKDSTDRSTGFGKNAFNLEGGKPYLLRFWIKASDPVPDQVVAGYAFSGGMKSYDPLAPATTISLFNAAGTTGLIDGWQQMEVGFTPPANDSVMAFNLPAGFIYDDFKLIPAEANSKGFVYHPVTRKLMATLDENNFATFYEYDAAGNLIRTKKETERGVLTLSESRSGHPKN